MTDPYYTDDHVTLYHGDCLEVTEWLSADVLCTDPPYGRGWRQGHFKGHGNAAHAGIANDHDTSTRDAALEAWGERPAVMFGDLMLAPPRGTVQTLVYAKALDAGVRGAMAGFRRDAEAVYLIGKWPTGIGGRTSILATRASLQGSPWGTSARHQHPHAKPGDVMEQLIDRCPPGVIADPFAGSGSTLVAARNLGRRAIGVELEERYCETVARRLAQGVLL